MKAYINVSNKNDIEILVKNLTDKKYDIYSDSETFEYLKNKNLKTILLKDLQEKDFDLVAIELDNFKKYLDVEMDIDTLISNIDIEKINLLRYFAKNYQKTIVISSSEDYKINLDEITQETKEQLALRAFLTTSKYDFLINKKLSKEFQSEEKEKAYYFNKIRNLKYGENPHQQANLYSFDKEINWVLLKGKELSYNNILNSSTALELASEFFDVPACIIIKHQTPVNVSLGQTLENAFDKALDSDPISPFNSVIAFTKKIELPLAKKLNGMNIKIILAPEFDFNALEELRKNQDLIIIQIDTPYEEILKFNQEEIKLTPFGALIQSKDSKDLDVATFKVVTKKKPEQKEVEDMIFAFKVAKHVKSCGIVIAKDLRTLGISSGEGNRLDAIENALDKVCDSVKGAIMATDGILQDVDSILAPVQNRISGIIQPAGSIKDGEIIKSLDKYELSMVTTGIRHLKH